MNRMLRRIVRGALLAALLPASLALAFRPADRPPLRDFDQRPAAAVAPAQPALAAAPASLQAPSSDLRMDQDAAGRVRFFRARTGFLTGPGGSGRLVSSRTAASVSAADPDRGLKAFLQEHRAQAGHGPEALAGARRTREFVGPRNGMRSVVFQQQVDGVPVFDAILSAHTTRQGELINIASAFTADPGAAAGVAARAMAAAGPALAAAQAVALAANAAGVALAPTQVSAAAPAAGAERMQAFTAPGLAGQSRAGLVWLPVEGALRLCWEVILTSRERGEMFRVLVDAETGAPWLRRSLTANAEPATYYVYTDDSPTPKSPGLSSPGSWQPPEVARELVTWTACSTNASPAGWIPAGDNTTLGNNVDAHLDVDGNDVPDSGSRPYGSPARVFNFALDLTQDPSFYAHASVVQLFYLNNWMHDRLYDLGFTEEAGNFQADNFGRGGLGGDAVQADAQDGSGTDNANFSTPPDGIAPRMQMFVFTGPSPDRDGDLDAEVVLHEYAHGLSNRRVGGGVGLYNLQSEGMGEGWSDFYALSLLSKPGDDPNACYASGGYVSYALGGLTQNYYYGIRRYPYSTDMMKNPLTFKDIDPDQASSHAGVPMSPIGGGYANEVHNMGEVWCVTLWEARASLAAKYGAEAGNALMLQLVTDGMALSPPNPNYLQARDAIIQADQVDNGGANYAELWAAFAKRGMGYNAVSPDSGLTEGLVESYSIPDDLIVQPAAGWSAVGYAGGPFSPTSSVYQMRNMGDASLSWTVATTAGWLSFSQAGGTLASGGSSAVDVLLNGSVAALAPGAYTATVRFRNVTSGVVQPVTVQLAVKEIPGRIELTDALAPQDDQAIPFGPVAPGFSRTETITVWNRDAQHDLVVNGVGFGFYAEDFNDGLAQGWAPETAIQWAVTNNEYRANGFTVDRLLQSAYLGEKWTDGRFRVHMRRTGDLYSAAVLALRATDDFSWTKARGSAYLIGTAGYGYYYIGKYVNGSFSMLQSWSSSPYLEDSGNWIEGALEGNRLTVTFNGHAVFSKTDDSLPGPGRMALLGYSGDYVQTIHYFDDITVSPPGAPASVSAAQSWYNDRPSGSADPLRAPADWTPPAYPGPDPSRDWPASSLGSMVNGPFGLDSLPDFPVRLAPGTRFSFNVSYAPVAPGSNWNTVVVRSTDASTPEVALALSGSGCSNGMEVLPSAVMTLGGRPGGPFPYSRGTFIVTNKTGADLEWTVSGAAGWLDVDPVLGTIPAGGSAAVAVSVNASAASLAEGVYSNALSFRNASVYGFPERPVRLVIRESPRLVLNRDSFAVTNMPEGCIPQQLTLGNTGTSNLVWALRLPKDEWADDVEGGEGAWTHSGVNDKWHVSTNRSASGLQSWYAGSEASRIYGNNMNASLVSPPLVLGPFARLSFRQWHIMEPNPQVPWDYGTIEISTNSGQSYATLLTVSGSNTSWAAESVDLSAYAGRTALIRFRFKSDSTTCNYEGWYVDEVNVTPLAVPAGNLISGEPVSGLVAPGGSASVTVRFNAAGLAVGDIVTSQVAVACNDVDRPSVRLPALMQIVPPLSVTVPAAAIEGAGLLAGAGKVSQGLAPEADQTIRLVSGDPAKVAVPESVILPAGQTNAAFDLTIGEDRKLDGTRAVLITAASDRFGYATISVQDNESTNLSLTLPQGGYEGQVFTNGARLAIGGTLDSTLAVTLAPSDLTECAVPATVTVPAGATSALFTVTLPLDGLMDGTQTGRVTASSAGFGKAVAPFSVRDRDVHHLSFSAIASPRNAGSAFDVTLTARDTNGETILVHRETVGLSASGLAGAAPLQPSNAVIDHGVWSGQLLLRVPDRAVRVTARRPGGLSYTSNPFDVIIGPVDHFAWGNVASPQNVTYAFKASVTARDAAENTVTGFTGSVTLSGFVGWEGEAGYKAVKIAPATAVKFAKGAWSGSVTVQEKAVNMCLKAADKAGHSGYSPRFTAGPLSLGVTAPAAIWEHDGALAKAGVVTLTRAVATNVLVKLASSDTTELRVPATVTVPAGKVSAAFTLTAVDDAVTDTAQTARITASLPGYVSASIGVEVRPAFVKKPVLTPPGGTFAGSRAVLVACATAGAQLRYTVNGSEVTGSSPLAPGSVSVTEACVLKVKGFKAGSIPSETASAVFRKSPLAIVANPAVVANLSAAPGALRAYRIDVPEFATNLTVAIRGGSGDCDLILRYGAMPDTNAYDYYPALDGNEESVSVPNPPPGAWYALLETGPAGYAGVTFSAVYQVNIPPVATPFVTPAGGIKVGSVSVAMSCATTGSTIRYTLNGSEPTATSTVYAAAFKLGPAPIRTVKAKAFKAGRPASDTATAEYQIAAALKAGTAITVSGGLNSLQYYGVKVPAGATQLIFTLSGGTGNANVYISRSLFPTLSVYERGSVVAGNRELIMINTPVAGQWYYVLVHGQAAFQNAALLLQIP